MSTNNTSKTSGRLAGFLYLLVAVTGYFPFAARQSLVVAGDPAQTAANILAADGLFRLTVVSDLAMTAFWIMTACALAVLFKAVGKHSCVLMVAFVLVGSAAVCANELVQIAALQLLQGPDYLASFAKAEREAMVMLLFAVSRYGTLISSIFFGLWLLPLGRLVFRSGYFPRPVGWVLGVLLMVAGFGYLADFLVGLLLPTAKVSFAQVTFVGELLLLLWLLVRGARLPSDASATRGAPGPTLSTTV